jgi:hypothetical protein
MVEMTMGVQLISYRYMVFTDKIKQFGKFRLIDAGRINQHPGPAGFIQEIGVYPERIE